MASNEALSRFAAAVQVEAKEGRVHAMFGTFLVLMDPDDALDLAKRITEAAQGLTDG